MAAKFRIRKMTADDVPELVSFLVKLDAHVAGVDPEHLELTETGERQLRQRLESFISEPGKRLVVAATAKGRPVGMGNIHIWHYADIWVNPERRGRRSGFIDDIWVEPDFRETGVAREIVTALLDFAEENGISDLTLEYALHSPGSAEFWENLGFKPTGVRAGARLAEVRARLRPADKAPRKAAAMRKRKRRKA